MIPGKIKFIFFLLLLNFFTITLSEEKIIKDPLTNLENPESNFIKGETESKNIVDSKKIELKKKKNNRN